MPRFFERLRSLASAAAGGGPRVAGPPRSANGASSFHLFWALPRLPGSPALVEVSATLEVLVPPAVSALYFWALQVDFLSGSRPRGGAHTGLQWNRRYPGCTAVNWGGYAAQEAGGQVLPGSVSSLPGFADDLNTLSYPWEACRPYRLRVYRPSEAAVGWRAEVTDIIGGRVSVIRDLLVDGDRLANPMVWSEVFADCDAPSVTIRWSDLWALDAQGSVLRPDSVRVNYQSEAEGGCTNTTVVSDGGAVLQVTNAGRTVRQGAVLKMG